MRRETAKGPKKSQQSSAPAQTQLAAKVIRAPAPKGNNLEVRTNNQQTAPVSAQRLKGQKAKPPKIHPVTTSC